MRTVESENLSWLRNWHMSSPVAREWVRLDQRAFAWPTMVTKSASLEVAVNKGDPSKPTGNEASIATAIKSSRSGKSSNMDRKDKSRGNRCLTDDSDPDSDEVRDFRTSNTVLITSKVRRVGAMPALSSKTSRRPKRDDDSKYLIHIQAVEIWIFKVVRQEIIQRLTEYSSPLFTAVTQW